MILKFESIHPGLLFMTYAIHLLYGRNGEGQTCLRSVGTMLAMKIAILQDVAPCVPVKS
jgi:hypothetical protein